MTDKEFDVSVLLNTIEGMASNADDKGESDFGMRISVKDAFGLCRYIYRLEAEHDALLSDVNDYQGSVCCYCKHIVRDNEKKRVYCGRYGDFPTSDGMPLMCGRFEWRGVQQVEREKA